MDQKYIMSEKNITVNITTTSGRKYPISVNPNDTAKQLKEKLKSKEHLEPGSISLSANAEVIPEGDTLAEHGIVSGSKITLVPFVKGGDDYS